MRLNLAILLIFLSTSFSVFSMENLNICNSNFSPSQALSPLVRELEEAASFDEFTRTFDRIFNTKPKSFKAITTLVESMVNHCDKNRINSLKFYIINHADMSDNTTKTRLLELINKVDNFRKNAN